MKIIHDGIKIKSVRSTVSGRIALGHQHREFWCRGYYVDTTGKNTAKIAAYIQNQLKEDKYGDQLTMFGKM